MVGRWGVKQGEKSEHGKGMSFPENLVWKGGESQWNQRGRGHACFDILSLFNWACGDLQGGLIHGF